VFSGAERFTTREAVSAARERIPYHLLALSKPILSLQPLFLGRFKQDDCSFRGQRLQVAKGLFYLIIFIAESHADHSQTAVQL
jgi:hypothetical protein